MKYSANTSFAALVIRHADNVAKGFALSTSVVLTFALSMFFFDYHLTWLTAFGASTVIFTAYSFECSKDVMRCLETFASKINGRERKGSKASDSGCETSEADESALIVYESDD